MDLAYVAVATSETARNLKRDIILELIRVRQPIARADLSRISGLQPSTVSSIVGQLIQEGWISEGAVAHRPRGRRPTMVSLIGELVILVVDLRPKQATVAVVDLNGRFLARQLPPLVSEPERAIKKVIACMQEIRKAHANKAFEGIGISMPGRVDPESQRLILAPNLRWSDYDVKGVIQKKMQLQVELENAANACLLSELWSGRLDGIRNAVLITLSEGARCGYSSQRTNRLWAQRPRGRSLVTYRSIRRVRCAVVASADAGRCLRRQARQCDFTRRAGRCEGSPVFRN